MLELEYRLKVTLACRYVGMVFLEVVYLFDLVFDFLLALFRVFDHVFSLVVGVVALVLVLFLDVFLFVGAVFFDLGFLLFRLLDLFLLVLFFVNGTDRGLLRVRVVYYLVLRRDLVVVLLVHRVEIGLFILVDLGEYSLLVLVLGLYGSVFALKVLLRGVDTIVNRFVIRLDDAVKPFFQLLVVTSLAVLHPLAPSAVSVGLADRIKMHRLCMRRRRDKHAVLLLVRVRLCKLVNSLLELCYQSHKSPQSASVADALGGVNGLAYCWSCYWLNAAFVPSIAASVNSVRRCLSLSASFAAHRFSYASLAAR